MDGAFIKQKITWMLKKSFVGKKFNKVNLNLLLVSHKNRKPLKEGGDY